MGAEEERKMVEERNETAELFMPITRLLKLAGSCPLTYVRREATGFVAGKTKSSSPANPSRHQEYTIDYRSPVTLVCFASGTLALAIWIIKLYGILVGVNILETSFLDVNKMRTLNYDAEQMSKNGRMSVDETIKAMFAMVPIAQGLGIVLSWLESKDFGNFLNNFQQFHTEFKATFPFGKQLPKSNISHTRNIYLAFYVFAPAVMALPAMLFVNIPHEVSFQGMFASTILGAQIAFVSLLEDVKVILTYAVLGDAFKQVKSGIIYSVKWETLTGQKVKSWTKLVQCVRDQASLAGKWQTFHQLMILVGSILVLTLTTFLILTSSPSSPNRAIFMMFNISIVLMVTVRISLKIYAAGHMSYEESMIARELVCISVAENESTVQFEVKFLHDMITGNPCLIDLGGYVTLNKKLIMGIASQVVTYLIVLMQFSQS